MKKLDNLQPIDLKDKSIKDLVLYFTLNINNDQKPDDWTVDDEMLMLSLNIQRELIAKRCYENANDVMTWRQNISKAVTATTDKLADDVLFRGFKIKDEMLYCFSDWAKYECYGEQWGSRDITLLTSDGESYAKTPKGTHEEKMYLMEKRAVEKAKRILEAEQEEEKERLEIERKAKKEVVIPFKSYSKQKKNAE
jgi:hypothetical protein